MPAATIERIKYGSKEGIELARQTKVVFDLATAIIENYGVTKMKWSSWMDDPKQKGSRTREMMVASKKTEPIEADCMGSLKSLSLEQRQGKKADGDDPINNIAVNLCNPANNGKVTEKPLYTLTPHSAYSLTEGELRTIAQFDVLRTTLETIAINQSFESKPNLPQRT